MTGTNHTKGNIMREFFTNLFASERELRRRLDAQSALAAAALVAGCEQASKAAVLRRRAEDAEANIVMLLGEIESLTTLGTKIRKGI